MFRICRSLKMMIIWNSFLVFFMAILTGCFAGKTVVDPLKIDEEIMCEINEAPQRTYEGSLWQDNGPLGELFMNPKARRVGDIVTISIVESSSASNNADTNTSRTSSISASLTNLLGLENSTSFPSGSGFTPFGSIQGSTNNSFQGSGTTNRSGELAASISARVTEALPNGNLRILGKREITINNERQHIALTGIIRPRDISPDNVILSTYISDARIAYTGTGVINDRQNPGWFARVLDSVWPF